MIESNEPQWIQRMKSNSMSMSITWISSLPVQQTTLTNIFCKYGYIAGMRRIIVDHLLFLCVYQMMNSIY